MQPDVEIDRIDQKVCRTIIDETNRNICCMAHGNPDGIVSDMFLPYNVHPFVCDGREFPSFGNSLSWRNALG